MNKKIYAILYFLLLFIYANGQNHSTIKGNIATIDNLPLEYANVSLHLVPDSSLITFAISDSNGLFEFGDLQTAIYFLKVSYIGLEDYYSDAINLKPSETLELNSIQLVASDNNLTEVEVTAKRPLIEIKPDKIIFNVDGTINATGRNALELLQKSPGVIVTNNDEITLLGQQGVQIYMDGKPSPLKGKDLADFLRGVQAAEIDNIEIISNPSSKYEAQGSGGIINFQLKKDKGLGLNSTIGLNYSVDRKQRFISSINSNYRNKKLNLFGNYSYKIGEEWSIDKLTREQGGTIFEKSNTTVLGWVSNNFKVGADVFLNKESTLGFQVNGFFSTSDWLDDSRTPIYQPGQSSFDSVLVSQYIIEGSKQNINYNINYQYKDEKGNNCFINADYLFYRDPKNVRQPNILFDKNENIISENIFENESPTNIDLFTFNIDYEREMDFGLLQMGMKSIYTKTNNQFEFFRLANEVKTFIPERSNQFVYEEMVHASYMQVSKKMERINFQVGLRAEQTASSGNLTTFNDTGFNNKTIRNYLDFFPSAGLTYIIDPKNSLQFNYSRRINRPDYLDLNPFTDQKDEFDFQQGNPFLLPEYSNKFQLMHSLNYQLYTSLSYSHTKDLIVSIRDTLDGNKTLKRWLNLADQNNFSLSLNYSAELYYWWSAYYSLTGFIVSNKTNLADDRLVDVKAEAYNIYFQNFFSLPKSFSLELSGWYNSPSIWGANFESDPIWNVDIGLQKKLWDKRGYISITVNDIFRSSGWYGVSRLDGITVTSSGYSDGRRLSVFFSYLFGNSQLKKVKKKDALEDVQERIQGGGSGKG